MGRAGTSPSPASAADDELGQGLLQLIRFVLGSSTPLAKTGTPARRASSCPPERSTPTALPSWPTPSKRPAAPTRASCPTCAGRGRTPAAATSLTCCSARGRGPADSGTEVGGFDPAFPEGVTLDMVAVSPDGRWLAVRGSDGLQVRDTADGRLVLECPHITYGYGLAFTPDGTGLAATRFGRPPGIEFWAVPGWRAGEPWASAIGPVKALAFSPD